MRIDRYDSMNETVQKEISTQKTLEKDQPHKSAQEIKKDSYTFFCNMSEQYLTKKPVEEKSERERISFADLQEMDINFNPSLESYNETDDLNFSKEELQQIFEDDPMYVNDRVLDYYNEEGMERNLYKEEGYHNGAIRWGDYATKEGVEYVTIDAGRYLLRYGDENGSFMTDIGTEYKTLEMPVSEDKRPCNLYEVLKSFPVEVSKVARQPWNIGNKTDETTETAFQYKTPVPISELVKEGFIRRLEDNPTRENTD